MMQYKDSNARTFATALLAAGFDVTHYRGRFGFEGPAAPADDPPALVRAIQATPRQFADILQWDNLGHGYILYGPPAKN